MCSIEACWLPKKHLCGCGRFCAFEVCLLESIHGADEPMIGRVLEAQLEHSKTGFARFLDMAGKTVNLLVQKDTMMVLRQILGY